MNANQIFSMVVRMVIRRLLRSGVNAGIDAVGKRMSGDKTNSGPDTAQTQQRMRQGMRVTKKMSRF